MAEWTPRHRNRQRHRNRHRRRRPSVVAVVVAVLAGLGVAVASAVSLNALLGSGDGSPPSSDDAADDGGSDRQRPDDDPGGDSPDGHGETPQRYEVWIPEIELRAPVSEVTADDQRVLHPPDDPQVAGWWSQGAAPGAPNGTALIVGHSDDDGGGAVFDGVAELEKDDVIVVNGGELPQVYEVSDVAVISADELARRAEALFDQQGPARLVLVTCEGWDGESFTANIVVTAEPAR